MKPTKSVIAGFLLACAMFVWIAWAVSSANYNGNQFSAVYPFISLKSGLLLTNTVLRGSTTGDAGTIADSLLSANIPLLNGNNNFTGTSNNFANNVGFTEIDATSASISNAVFQNGMVFTNGASGNWGYFVCTSTNFLFYNIGTNGGGGYQTNLFKFGNGIGTTLFGITNSSGQTVFIIKQDGGFSIGTNNQVSIDNTGIITTHGAFFYGDQYKTNGVWIGAGGEVLSNNLGSVTIQGGNIWATNFVGAHSGLVISGAETNAAGSRVAYLSDMPLDPLVPSNFIMVEDFPNDNGNVRYIGTHGWNAYNVGTGSFSPIASIANHPGIFQLVSSATLGNGAVIMLDNDTNSVSWELLPPLNGLTGWTNTWSIKLSGTNDIMVWCGLLNNMLSLTQEPANWMGFQYEATNANIITYKCMASSSPTTANGPVIDSTTYHKLQMWSTVAGTIAFSVDGANAQTINSNVPTTALSPFIAIWKSASTTSVTLNIDYCTMVVTGLSR